MYMFQYYKRITTDIINSANKIYPILHYTSADNNYCNIFQIACIVYFVKILVIVSC